MADMTELVKRISGVNPRKCMKCGKCTAACPAYDEMDYHPHQFVDMVETGRLEELMNSKGIYMCLSCFACLERCPRSVEPAKLIEAVRLAVVRQQDMVGGVHDLPHLLEHLLLRRGEGAGQNRDFFLLVHPALQDEPERTFLC